MERMRGMHREASSPSPTTRPALCRLARLLLGEVSADVALPPVADLTACATSLATGVRTKALLPLAGAPIELALVRRGSQVLVSCYGTGSAPEVHVLERAVEMGELLDGCARAAMEAARFDGDPHSRRLAVRLAERALRAETVPDPEGGRRPVSRRGGEMEPPSDGTPLSFGYTASIFPGAAVGGDRSVRADVHALLFEGTLWAHVRGRRILLSRGPIMLPVQRMVDAVRALVDAWDAGRPVNVRLRSQGFRIGVRLDRHGEVTLTLGSDSSGEVTATALDVPQVALPILRVASELVRALVSADRSQSRNLRVRTLREDVRALRRAVRSHGPVAGFVNHDPDRLRVGAGDTRTADPGDSSTASDRHSTAASASLRFTERWRFELDGLDAANTFLCGDRVVISTPRHVLALGRNEGDVLWARDGGGASAWMAGQVLMRALPDGMVELCDVEDGEPFAHARIAPRGGHILCAVTTSGSRIPPVAIVTEGPRRLVAIDLRTGELRWRFVSRGDGALHVRRAGRILLVACGEGAVSALDIATGEVVWRFGDRLRFAARPAVTGEVVVATAGEGGGERGSAHGIDLYTGAPLWSRELSGAPTGGPVACQGRVIVPLRNGAHALDAQQGDLAWESEDPGLSSGGAALALDRQLIVNAPGGRLTSLCTSTGRVEWRRSLSHPLADDVPRTLAPVLRGGALFVPAASVQVIRPSDGASLGDPLPGDLVPDMLHVDERGWVYVVEESGQLAAIAPAPRLRLIRGSG